MAYNRALTHTREGAATLHTPPKLHWQAIDHVLLDMDGTLLDLHFDNYFWRQHVPLRYAEKYELEVDEAKQKLFPIFRSVEGTIDWYCVDYWSETLGLDIAELKREVDHLIAVHPTVPAFLAAVRESGRRSVLVTNAHHKALTLKMERTGLDAHLDLIICAHDFGVPKEDQAFWQALRRELDFEPARSLLIDDSLPVLRAAREYGIGQLLAVYQPDTKEPRREITEFPAIHGFDEIMPGKQVRGASSE